MNLFLIGASLVVFSAYVALLAPAARFAAAILACCGCMWIGAALRG